MSAYNDKRLLHILEVSAKELDRRDAEWAVGGAVAMAAHGYKRDTEDIDIFAGDDVREDLFAHLKEKRIDVDEIVPEIHYTAIPDPSRPEVRVDFLFPSAEPDVSAIMNPARARLGRHEMPVWPMHLIVASKLLSTRDKDAFDLGELRNRGLVDADAVVRVLQEMREREAITRLRELMKPRDRDDHERTPRGRRR